MLSNLQQKNSRINITLELETKGCKKKKELPMKILVMGRLSKKGDDPSVRLREKLNVNRENFNEVMKNILPHVDLMLKDCLGKSIGLISVNLSFEGISDFNPNQIIKKVPILNNLMTMRNLLKELKANLNDSEVLRESLSNVVRDQSTLDALRSDISLPEGSEDAI